MCIFDDFMLKLLPYINVNFDTVKFLQFSPRSVLGLAVENTQHRQNICQTPIILIYSDWITASSLMYSMKMKAFSPGKRALETIFYFVSKERRDVFVFWAPCCLPALGWSREFDPVDTLPPLPQDLQEEVACSIRKSSSRMGRQYQA